MKEREGGGSLRLHLRDPVTTQQQCSLTSLSFRYKTVQFQMGQNFVNQKSNLKNYVKVMNQKDCNKTRKRDNPKNHEPWS